MILIRLQHAIEGCVSASSTEAASDTLEQCPDSRHIYQPELDPQRVELVI
jgi:hypothetical protein